MWFNILPPFLIITASLGLPAYGLYWIHYLALGNHFRRNVDQRWERHLYTRDVRLTGSPYKMQGLETLDDLDVEQLAMREIENANERKERKRLLELKKQRKMQEKISRMIAD